MVPGWLARTKEFDDTKVLYFEFGSSGESIRTSSYDVEKDAHENYDDPRPVVLLLGGLTDGPLSLPYAPRLSSICRAIGWRFIAPILRSSFNQFGFCSLETDAEDIRNVIASIVQRVHPDQRPISFALMGHSTGCQDVVAFLKNDLPEGAVIAKVILQAAVSDREALHFLEDETEIAQYIELATVMRSRGDEDEFMPRAACKLFDAQCITASRFLSLSGRLTPDDLFSSDLTDEELEQVLGHVGRVTPDILVMLSKEDEFVPSHLDTEKHCQRLATALGGADVAYIDGPHDGGPVGSIGWNQICEGVIQFLGRNPPKQALSVSWELEIAQLIKKMIFYKENASERFVVGICGMPCTGKSSSSLTLGALLEAPILALDGFHYPKQVLLSSFPDPTDALYRRGAPDTFDRPAFERMLTHVKAHKEKSFQAPVFDHAVGDPRFTECSAPSGGAGRGYIPPSPLLVVEGIYLLLWPEIRQALDLCVYIDDDLNECVERLKVRNLCIPGYTKEEMIRRVENVDRNNCELVQGSKAHADRNVKVNSF